MMIVLGGACGDDGTVANDGSRTAMVPITGDASDGIGNTASSADGPETADCADGPETEGPAPGGGASDGWARGLAGAVGMRGHPRRGTYRPRRLDTSACARER
jgi:hypothetical protein